VIGGLAIFGTILGILERYSRLASARGLIYDMRSKVFEHIQKMPSPSSRGTQTGALISRLTTNVPGAQQAFTEHILNSSERDIGEPRLAAMFYLSGDHAGRASHLAGLSSFRRAWSAVACRRSLASPTDFNAEMTTMMTERFNVAGALLVKLFGRPRWRPRPSIDVLVVSATSASHKPMYARFFLRLSLSITAASPPLFVYGGGGFSRSRIAERCTVVALTGAYLDAFVRAVDPALNVQVGRMTALVLVRSCLRGTRPPSMIAEIPDAIDLFEVRHSRIRRVDFAYPGASGGVLASLESVAAFESTRG